ncbi:MAG TPA: acyl carrier protein, partial [Longimicrobiaceae bacterium]|nr:acyl carrier protein [Longimicrobiaceae bacterium]
PEGERRAVLGEHVRATVVAVLGLDPARPLERGRPLKEMGLDSLTAVEIRNALSAAAGHPLPATLLFDHPTVDALAAFLAREVFGVEPAEGAAPAAAPEDDTLAAALAEVEASRGDELALLLAGELDLIEGGRQG